MGAITPLNRWCNGAGGPGARSWLQFRYYAVVVWWVIAHYSPHGPMQIASSIRKPRPLRVSLTYIHPLPTTHYPLLYRDCTAHHSCCQRHCGLCVMRDTADSIRFCCLIFLSFHLSIDGTIGCGGIAGMWVTLARESESQRLRVGLSTRPIAQYTRTHTETRIERKRVSTDRYVTGDGFNSPLVTSHKHEEQKANYN